MGRVTYLSTGHPYTVVEPCGVDDSDIGVPLIAPSLQKARDRIRRDRLECGRDEPERIDCLPFGRGRTLVLVYEDQHNEPPLQLVYEEEPDPDPEPVEFITLTLALTLKQGQDPRQWDFNDLLDLDTVTESAEVVNCSWN